MIIRNLMVIATILAMIADPARAELRGVPTGTPDFTKDELQIISRNQALSQVAKIDPWVVRKLLDTLDKFDERPSITNRAADPLKSTRQTPEIFDSHTNPDAERLQRASPEAIHDLFQLIKQAKDKKLIKPK